MNDIKAIFGERLKEARFKKKMTQAQLAESCQTKQSAVSSFEKGKAIPNLEVAAEIAKLLDVSIDWLCGFDEKKQEISPYQWVKFMDSLISKSPVIYGTTAISINTNTQKAGNISLVFSGKEMQVFFSAYNGIQSLREIDQDLYDAALYKLCEKNAFLFTPGLIMRERGEDVAHPPIWR